jgi:5-methylthioadenosine/S-adenosylhomocysteine deaminase
MSLAVTGALHQGEVIGLRAASGVIAEIGADVSPQDGDDVLDAAGSAVLPGLVNGHTHAAMTLFRGYGSDLPLMEWLETRIWPKEALLTDDDVYWGTRLACLEMVRCGTVRFWDMYWRPDAVARAVEDGGMRATVGMPFIDGLDPAVGEAGRSEVLANLDAVDARDDRVTASLTPHGIYTVSEESLRWLGEQARERDLPLQLHFLEVQDEVSGLQERTGERPAAYLDRLGVLTPKTVLAHGVWLEDDDLELIAERGSIVVTNPASNMKLAVGRAFPYRRVRAHGIPVGIGTDGASSNNSLDLLADVKLMALLQKHAEGDPSALPASEAWEIATATSAPGLGQSGRLEVGAPADFILVRLDAPELTPGDLIANLVYAASGAVVDSTVVAGRVLMRRRVVDDEEEIRAKAMESVARLGLDSD